MNLKRIKLISVITLFALLFFYLNFVRPTSLLHQLLFYLLYICVVLLLYHTALRDFYANAYCTSGQFEKAVPLLQKSISKKSKNPTVYHNYGVYLLKEGRAQEALDLLKKALICHPSILMRKNLMLSIGSCYWLLGDIDEAIATLKEMEQQFEYINEHVLVTLGYMYILKNDLENASTYTYKALEINPSFASGLDNLGQIYYVQGDTDRAIEAFQKAVEHKDLVDSYYYLGRIEQEKEHLSNAKAYFEKALTCPITALNTVTTEEILASIATLPIE